MPPKQKKQKTGTTKSSLEKLAEAGTVLVADSADFQQVKKYSPQNSTTNPSLILAAAKKKEYKELLDNAIAYGQENGANMEKRVEYAMDKLLVEFGSSILEIIPGKVSTEVDARLSFDKEATIRKALRLIELYEEVGVSKDRVLIKIGATWEGIQAAQELEKKHSIHTNLTLLFSFVQAVACAEAGVTLVSPFVGRILDFYKQKTGKEYSIEDHPGILAVKRIYYYYKKYGYDTNILGASYRTLDEIKAVAGLDSGTISLPLLEQLVEATDDIPRQLYPEDAEEKSTDDQISYINEEPKFRYDLNDDEAATVKIAEGIRKFAADAISLQQLIEEKMNE